MDALLQFKTNKDFFRNEKYKVTFAVKYIIITNSHDLRLDENGLDWIRKSKLIIVMIMRS